MQETFRVLTSAAFNLDLKKMKGKNSFKAKGKGATARRALKRTMMAQEQLDQQLQQHKGQNCYPQQQHHSQQQPPYNQQHHFQQQPTYNQPQPYSQ